MDEERRAQVAKALNWRKPPQLPIQAFPGRDQSKAQSAPIKKKKQAGCRQPDPTTGPRPVSIDKVTRPRPETGEGQVPMDSNLKGRKHQRKVNADRGIQLIGQGADPAPMEVQFFN